MALNDTFFFHGDSKVAIDNPRSYHDILCSNVGKIDRYWGSFGRTMQKLTTNYPTDNSIEDILDSGVVVSLSSPGDGMYAYDGSVERYFICFGTNDIIQMADPANTIDGYKNQYHRYIDKALELNWPLESLYIINCDIIDFTKQPGSDERLNEFNGANLQVAKDRGVHYIDVCSNQRAQSNPLALLDSEGLHLSLLGNTLNAEYIEAHLNDAPPVNPTQLFIFGRNFYVAEPEPDDELWRTVFTHAYFAKNSLDDNDDPIQNGTPVKTLKDQIGDVDLVYDGVPEPLLSGLKPKYYAPTSGIESMIFMENVTGIKFSSAALPVNFFPRERMFILTSSQYSIFEGLFGAEYLADRGFGSLRTRSNTEWPGDESWFSSIGLTENQTAVIRQQIIDEVPDIPEAGGADRSFLVKTRLWVNGVLEPKILATNRISPYALGFGVDTNNAHIGMQALFYKEGIIDDETAATLTAQLMTKYNVGNELAVPYANSLSFTHIGNQYTLSYAFKAIGGVGEDTSKRRIRWINLTDGPTTATAISEVENLLTFNTADHPTYNFTGKSLRVEITCYDTQGRFHPVPQSIFNLN